MSESEVAGLTAEATGETVGEAKWAALRELERRYPGLDKAAVQFEVVAEGERGILGVGYEPARVVAHLPAAAVEVAAAAAAVAAAEPEAGETGDRAADARALVARIVQTLGVDADVTAREEDEGIVVTCSGPDVGLLIGRHGQTIDAIQYLLNAVAWRAHREDRKEVVVDAAGYRARRQATLESLALRTAERVRDTGEREELEPMTAVERKVVHLRLKDEAGVATTSEGTEPNRYVVVVPD
jgi:spoIIIJ-associated protein